MEFIYKPNKFYTKQYSDLTLILVSDTEYERIDTHKVVLINLSRYFANLISYNNKESIIIINNPPDISIAKLIIESLYDNIEYELSGTEYDFMMGLYLNYNFFDFYDEPELKILKYIQVPPDRLDEFVYITGSTKYQSPLCLTTIKDKLEYLKEYISSFPSYDDNLYITDQQIINYFKDTYKIDKVDLVYWIKSYMHAEFRSGIVHGISNDIFKIYFYNIKETIEIEFKIDAILTSDVFKNLIYQGIKEEHVFIDLDNKMNVINAYIEFVNNDNSKYYDKLETIDDICWFIFIFKKYQFKFYN